MIVRACVRACPVPNTFGREFTCEDEQGRAVGAVDKNFAGLGTIVQTLFTDAHTYLVHLHPGSSEYDFSARYSYAPSQQGQADASPPLQLPPGWDLRCGMRLPCASSTCFAGYPARS